MRNKLWPLILIVMFVVGCASAQVKKETALRTRNLGEAFLVEKKYAPAYREFLKAEKLNPKDPILYYDFGLFYYERKELDKAVEAYKKAIKLKPDFASAINNLGVVYMEKEEWDKAIKTLLPITESYVYATPHYPCFLVGQAYYHKQNYKKAVEYFKKAIELQPDYVFAYHWLGRTYITLKMPKEAVSALEQAVKKTPGVAVFHLDLGRAYQMAGKYKKAKDAFARAAALATDEALKKEALYRKALLSKRR